MYTDKVTKETVMKCIGKKEEKGKMQMPISY